jgi:hypothetical protein
VPEGDQLADVGAELVVVVCVDDGCGEWAALGIVVLHQELAPGRHDHANRFRKRSGAESRERREAQALLLSPYTVGPDIGTSRLPFAAASQPGIPARRLPNSKLDLLDANHFVWADRAEDYAALVINWWNDGYKRP